MTTPYPGPCSVLILDNARIHHMEEIKDLIRDYGIILTCLLGLILIIMQAVEWSSFH
jgi:heme/copper-type cytochrome/quinol oxidase subunit 3